MIKIKNIKISFLLAGGVFIYVGAIALFMFNVRHFFNQPDSFLAPVFMLLLFVISAATTGYLILGKPLMLFLDNQKKEAIGLLFSILGWLVIFLVITAILLSL
jgi:uncharacterized membrane protein YbhN (UPF0104 family)